MASAIVPSRTISMACDYPPREELNTLDVIIEGEIGRSRLRNQQMVARNQESEGVFDRYRERVYKGRAISGLICTRTRGFFRGRDDFSEIKS